MTLHKRHFVFAGFAAVISLAIGATFALAPPSTGIVWRDVLPEPPISGGAIDRADQADVMRLQRLVNTPRWQQAKRDVSYDIFVAFSSVLGADFTASQRPQVAALLDYSGRYVHRASNEAKAIHPRPRPYRTLANLQVCQSPSPINSSYPSGHAAWGVVAARILAQLYPSQTKQILARGLDYGQSRVVCAVHYPSDVSAGQMMADAMLAQLENDDAYLRLLAAAKRAVRVASPTQ